MLKLMMSKEATQIIEWEGTDGSLRSLLMVVDESKSAQATDYKQLEVASYDKESDEWTTDETLDSVENINSVGIPEDILS